MTDAKRQPSWRRGLGIIAAAYVIAWHAGFAFWNQADLMQSPREFLRDYVRDIGWILLPFGASPHDGDPFFAQICADAVGLAVSIIVIVYLAWKRTGEND
jgi:hypothetical protein